MLKYLIIILIFLSACTNSVENNQKDIFTIDRFPNNPGNNWNYYVFNEYGEKTGNLSCKIISDTTVNHISSNVWQYISTPDSPPDTTVLGYITYRFIITYDKSISFNYIRNLHYYIETLFQFPLSLSKEWKHSFSINGMIIDQDYRVINIESLTLESKIYDSCFRILQKTTAKDSVDDPDPLYTENIEWWIAPDIGIVKQHESLIIKITQMQGSQLDTVSATSELKDYSLM